VSLLKELRYSGSPISAAVARGKMMYGKRTTGVIRSTAWIGADGKVRKRWRRVAKAADRPVQVLAAFEKGG